MALSNLSTALTNVEAAIESLSAKVADPTGYTIEGLSVQRQRLKELLEVRNMLKKQIAEDPSNSFEVWSRWV